jgi:hypothetical protein
MLILGQNLLAPYDYLMNMPSKGFRGMAIEALNVWFDVPEGSLTRIRAIIDYLHSSSLLWV